MAKRSEIVSRYLASCQARRLSPRTIAAYRWALMLLPDPVPEDPDAIVARMGELSSLSTESLRDVHRVWRSLYLWASRRNVLPNAMAEVAPPKKQKRYPRVFTPAELARIWAACHTNRDRALVAFALATGARLGEIANLTRAKIRGGSVVLDGKTGPRTIPMPAQLQSLIRDITEDSPHVWLGPKRPLTRTGVVQVFKRIMATAGIDGRKTGPHTFRHTFGTEYVRAGGSVFALQKLMGHASVTSTMLYVHMIAADLERDVEAYTPIRYLLGESAESSPPPPSV